MKVPGIRLAVLLMLLAIGAGATGAAVRIGGAKYKGKQYATLRTEDPEHEKECAVIVSYDRSRARCLDEGRRRGERVREVGTRFCRKLALLPGEHTIEAKILEYGRAFREGAALNWSYSPTAEARSLSFSFEGGQTYRLEVSIHGDLRVQCRRARSGLFKWGACPD